MSAQSAAPGHVYPDSPYKFYAFISYSHADEAFVKKLQDKIESYRLPSSLQRLKEGLPSKVHPIFRDATDLPPGQLSDEIRKKLTESKYLLVICSPHSAGSYWVNQEIAEFRRLGRPENIIPIIIDGEVNAADQKRECFPSLLLDEVRQGAESQLLGVSVPKEGPRRAILKVIAKMLELDPDELLSRDRVRERKRRIAWAAAVSFLILLFGGGGLYYWDYHREKVSRFADYVETRGLPEGIFSLTEEGASHRAGHYRFLSQRRKLQEVAYVDSAGRPVPHRDPEFIDRPAIQRFAYEDHSGRLLETRHLDHNGNLNMRLVFSGNGYTAIDFKRANEENETLQAWLAAQTTSAAGGQFGLPDPGAARGQVQRWKVTRDPNGHIAKIEYKQLESVKPAQDKDGVHGQALTLDELGRVRERRYLDAEGRNFTTPTGLAGQLYTYDGPNLVETVNIDAKGQPVLDDRKRMVVDSRFDEFGRKTEELLLNREGDSYPDDRGVARTAWQYDQAGRLVEEAWFGIDDRPRALSGGQAGWRMAYDGPSREKTFFGTNGQPRADTRGVARIRETLDGRGNVLETAYFGLDGSPRLGPEGVCRLVRAYDPQGRVIEESYYGVDDQPQAGRNGYARVTRTFNEFGVLAEEAFWGVDGKPALNREGVARIVNTFDDRGVAEMTAYYGADGRKTLNNQGFASLKLTADALGRPITLAFFGVDDQPVESRLGYARSVMTWTERNLMDEIHFFDAEGKPADPGGQGRLTGLKYEYDDEGRTTGTAFFDAEGRLGPTTKQSEPTAVDTIPEEGPVVVKPQFADFQVFSGPAGLEMTVYNTTDSEVRLSRALSDMPGLEATFPDGRTVPARGSVRLRLFIQPPARTGGRLDGGLVALGTSHPERPMVVIALLGQFNPDSPAPPKAESARPMTVPVIGYNPQKGPNDPFDYFQTVTDGRTSSSTGPDGSRTETTMNDRGLAAESRTFNAKGELEMHFTYGYDDQGKLNETTMFQPDGARSVSRFGPDGQVTESTEFRPDGSRSVFKHAGGEVSDVRHYNAQGVEVDLGGKPVR